MLFIALSFWLRLIDKLTDAFLKTKVRGYKTSGLTIEKVIHRTGDYSLVQIVVGEGSGIAGSNLKDTDFKRHDTAVLAIERGEKTIAQPGPEEQLQAGDRLLCYGKSTDISEIAGNR